jgi:cytochrome bd-type quinol oxidase subunit 2
MALQCFSYTVIAPIYLFIHLLTSPVAHAPQNEQSFRIESNHLAALPYTIALGYILPSVAMGLESNFVSSATHQRLIALWQFFPLLTTLVHYLIVSLMPFQAQKKSSDTTQDKKRYLAQTRTIHTLLLILCTSTHLHSLTFAVVHGDFVKRFLPHSLLNGPHTKVPTLAIGVKNFLQWDIYIGCLAILLWSALLYHETRQLKTVSNSASVAGRGQIWFFSLTALIAGPMGIVIWLLGEREKLVFGDTGDRKINKRA